MILSGASSFLPQRCLSLQPLAGFAIIYPVTLSLSGDRIAFTNNLPESCLLSSATVHSWFMLKTKGLHRCHARWLYPFQSYILCPVLHQLYTSAILNTALGLLLSSAQGKRHTRPPEIRKGQTRLFVPCFRIKSEQECRVELKFQLASSLRLNKK